MAPRTIYANLSDGLQSFSLWDQSLADMGLLGVLPYTATGTNTILLTAIATAYAPTPTAYGNYIKFSFVAVNTSTGPITAQVGTLTTLKVYKYDGVSIVQAGVGDIINGLPYTLIYYSALNGNAGGFFLTGAIAGVIGFNTAASYTVTGNWTFDPVSGTAIAINPATGTTDKAIDVTQVTQTSGSINVNQAALNQFTITSKVQNVATGFTNGLPNSSVDGVSVVYTTGGTNVSGTNQFATHSQMQVLTATNSSTVYGMLGSTYISASNSNTGAGVGGVNGYAIVDNGGSIGVVEGLEAETGILGTGTATFRGGVVIDAIGTKTASTLDAAILITTYTGWNGSTSAGAYGNLIAFSQAGGAMGSGLPLAATASFFLSDASFNATNFAALSNVTFSGDYLYFVDARMSATSGTKGWLTLGRNDVPDAPLTINANTGTTSAVAGGTSFHAIGADSAINVAVLDTFAGTPIWGTRRANNTRVSKSVVVANDIIMQLLGTGWDSTVFGTAARVEMQSTETWSATAHGSRISLFTVAATTTTVTENLRLHGSGGLSVGNANVSTDPGAGIIIATAITAATIEGGTAAGSTLTLKSTTNGSPSGDSVAIVTGGSTHVKVLSTGPIGMVNETNPQAGGLTVSLNATTGVSGAAANNNTPLRLIAVDGGNGNFEFLTFGSGTSAIVGTNAGGTAAIPSQSGAAQNVIQFQSRTRDDASAYNTNATIQFKTVNATSTTDHSSQIVFQTTPTSSTTLTTAMVIQASGGLSIGTTSDPGLGMIYTNSASFIIRTKTSYTDGAGASTGTLTNAPSVGNPTKWIAIDDNGTTRRIPAW